MTAVRRRQKPLTIHYDLPAHLPESVVLNGAVRAIQPAIRAAGCAWQWDNVLHAIKIPRARLDDVLAQLDLAGHHVVAGLPGWTR